MVVIREIVSSKDVAGDSCPSVSGNLSLFLIIRCLQMIISKVLRQIVQVFQPANGILKCSISNYLA